MRLTVLTLLLLFPLGAPASEPAAAEPPSPELLDDIDRWQRGFDALLAGPSGCWDLVGDVDQVFTLHQPPDFFSAARNQSFPMDGTVRGRMVDGTWRGDLEKAVKPQGHELDLDVPIYPLFGHFEKRATAEERFEISIGDEDAKISGSVGQSVNLLRQAIDEWAGVTETAFAQWDRETDAILYLRELPVSKQDSQIVRVTARFPDRGEHADRIDAIWPRLVKLGEWPARVKVRDAQMHVVGLPRGERTLPWAESVSLTVGVLGFTAGYEQTVRWRTATPCVEGADTPPPAAPPIDE